MHTATAWETDESPAMPSATQSTTTMFALAVSLCASLFGAALVATRWPLVHDVTLLDYIAFLIRNGFAPYRDIVDMNMPGAYLLQLLQTGIFGLNFAGLLAWVSAEIVAVITASVWIARPDRRWAGLVAGCLASLIHLSHGPRDLGQRDWDVAVLLLISCACLISYFRAGRYRFVAAAFLFGGLAGTIKPQAILFPVAGLVYLCIVKDGLKTKCASAALIGVSAPIGCVLLFLAKYHSFGAFFSDTRRLAGYYASLAHPGFVQLAWGRVSFQERVLIVICLSAVPIYIQQKLWRSVEMNVIGIGASFGISSYFLQDKGWNYHRMPGWIFASLWVIFVIEAALRQRKVWVNAVSYAVALAIFMTGPFLFLVQAAARYPMDTVVNLQRDITNMGAGSGNVQCLDMTAAGCVNVLYRLRLKQETGFIYDFYLFPEHDTPLTTRLQSRFLADVTLHPPELIVLSSHIWPGDRFGYDEISNWPAFESYLATHYKLVRQYEPPATDRYIAGYRIYRLCGVDPLNSQSHASSATRNAPRTVEANER